jgi:hypothetical protein
LPVSKHAAKLKTGSTGSCDQLARVPLVQLWRKPPEFEIELVSSVFPASFHVPLPPFYLTFDLRWITIHTFVSTLDY